MEIKLPLTPLQSAGWASAKRESILSESRIEELKTTLAELEEQIKTEARIAAARYMGVLSAIFGEHNVKDVPENTRLEQDGENYFFVYERAETPGLTLADLKKIAASSESPKAAKKKKKKAKRKPKKKPAKSPSGY